MDPSVSGSSAPQLPDDVARIEHEIEALKAFLARYPPPPDAAVFLAENAPAVLSDEPTRAGAWLLGTRRRQIVAGVALLAVAAVALPRLPFSSAAGEESRTGTLSVSTNPSGMTVHVDGTRRGATPLTVDLPPGDHMLEIVTRGERRRIPVTITAGAQVSHFLELAPLAVELAPASASPPISAVATAGTSDSNAAGWISVAAPSDVQVREDGRLLGTSTVERIMLPVGRHELEFVNETLGYRAVQTVHVNAGEVVPLKLRWPQGSVALNALPWAEVWIDGQPVGETPIGNLALPIGVHEIVFRHPELGERRASVTVVTGKTATLGVDLGTK